MSINTILIRDKSEESQAAVDFLQSQNIAFSEVDPDTRHKAPTLVVYGRVYEGLAEIKHAIACHWE